MRRIIYYAATSIDGFISGPDGDISGFLQEGKGVRQYLEDLQSFDTVIMGRKTYEFGYKFGLQPGQPAYPHMKHYIFSNTLEFENPNEKVRVCRLVLEQAKALKEQQGSDIYLCGGGEFAGWLLEHKLIDVLKIKLNPLILGAGIRLFGASNTPHQLVLTDRQSFDDGLQILTYDMIFQA